MRLFIAVKLNDEIKDHLMNSERVNGKLTYTEIYGKELQKER
jgi:2'-5' RNA ligase